MAIYQYKIDLIPRKSIIEKYGEVPNQLFIDHEAWEKYWDMESTGNGYDFEDALTILWWKEIYVSFEKIEPFIETFTKQIEWSRNSTNYYCYGYNETNDFSIETTIDGFINEFCCRFDLRELDKDFIENIFILTNRLDCLLIDRNGNLFEPTFEKLFENIKHSNSFKFVSNTKDFFDKLSNGQIKPE